MSATVGGQPQGRSKKDAEVSSPGSPSSSSPPPSSRLSLWHAEINRVADGLFYRLGRQVALNPKSVIALALFAVLVCCSGFANFRVESAASRLWVPRESISRTQEETIKEFFDEGTEWALVLLEHPDEGGNVLTKLNVDVLWDLDARIVELETGAGEVFSDLCVKELDGETCAQPFSGVTTFWGDDFEAYTTSVTDNDDVLEAINVEQFPGGRGVAPAAIFGNSVVYDDDGNITGARVMMQTYALARTGGDEDQEEVALGWLGMVQDYLGEEAGNVEGQGMDMVYFTSRSLDDALSESVAGEIFLFVATYVVMIVCVMLCVGRCKLGAVERRSWLGLGGVGIVVASGVAAYGVCSGFAVPFTSLSQLLPFILIGIGVDDMFVILASLDHTDVGLPVEERLALALERCGVSITYTSLTNFSAFLLGSITKLPAVEYFCVYAATSILFVFILQVTVFTAFLAMDLNRQQAGKMDWCCCCTSKTYLEERAKRGVGLSASTLASSAAPPASATTAASEGNTNSSRTNSMALARGYRRQTSVEEEKEGLEAYVNPMASLGLRAASHAVDSSRIVGSKGGGGGGKGRGSAAGGEVGRLTAAGKWMRDKYAPFLLSTKGKVLVFMATASLLIAGIYGVTKAKQGFDALDLAPDDHFARDFMETARLYNLEPDSYFVGMEIYTPAVDYTNSTVQAYIQVWDTLMIEQKHFTGPVDSWLTSFVEWAATTPDYSANVGRLFGYWVYQDPSTFYSALDDFLKDGSNQRFQSDLAFDDNGEIEMSFSSMFVVDLTDTDAEIKALKDARDVMDRSPLEPRPFASAGIFLYAEQYLVLYQELVTNFLLALVAVAALSLVVLGTVRVVLLVCVTVLMIDVELLGFVYHWGLEVNAINVIELIMAVGLVVDYMVHIVHYYLHQDPRVGRDLRIRRALGEIGPSVVVGAVTTFLGIMPMAFANNVIFRVFFKMFFVIITFGFFHGVVFIPVALSLLPESSWCSPSSSSSSSASANRVSDARKVADESDTAERDPGPYDWLVFTGRFGTGRSTRSKASGEPVSASTSETENGGSGGAPTSSVAGRVDAGSGRSGGDGGGGDGGGDGARSLQEDGGQRVGNDGHRGAVGTARVAAAAAAAAGGGHEVVQVEGGGGPARGSGGAVSGSNSRRVDVVDVEAGSGLGSPEGKRKTDSRGSATDIWGPDDVDSEKLGTSPRTRIPQAETLTSKWTKNAEVGSGLETATREVEDFPGGEWNMQVETGSGLGAPIKSRRRAA